MARIKDQGICIRHLDWSETSQIVTLMTREHGKLRGIAKGARRSSPGAVARYSGGIDLLTGGEVLGIIKPSTDLATLTEWDLQRPYRHLRTDLEAQRLGLYAADLVNAMLADHDAHATTYDALADFLEAMAQQARRVVALLRFQWRLLEDAGYRPQIDRDARDGNELNDAGQLAFDPRAGGVVNPASLLNGGTDESGPGPWRVRRETIDALRGAMAGDWDRIDERSAERANRLLCVYARAIIDRELATMAIVLGMGAG